MGRGLFKIAAGGSRQAEMIWVGRWRDELRTRGRGSSGRHLVRRLDSRVDSWRPVTSRRFLSTFQLVRARIYMQPRVFQIQELLHRMVLQLTVSMDRSR